MFSERNSPKKVKQTSFTYNLHRNTRLRKLSVHKITFLVGHWTFMISSTLTFLEVLVCSL